MRVTTEEIVAAEAHCHLHWYSNYTRIHQTLMTMMSMKHSDSEKESCAEHNNYVRTDIIPNKTVVVYTFLTARFESLMQAKEICQLGDSTEAHPKKPRIRAWQSNP